MSATVETSESPPRALQTRGRSRWLGPTAAQAIWALVDQAVVSGTRFGITILIGRACGAEQLGLWAIAFSIWLIISCVQQSLFLMPFTIIGSRLCESRRRRFLGSSLLHQGVLAILSMLGLSIASAAAFVLAGDLAVVLAGLALAIPGLLLLDAARRFEFAALRVRYALAFDIAACVLQLTGLSFLVVTGSISPGMAFVMVGAASGMVGFFWLLLRRKEISIKSPLLRIHLLRYWAFGKWIWASQQSRILSTSGVYWIVAAMLGATATGIYSACSILVVAANPVLLGLANVVEPKSAVAFKSGGTVELLRVSRKVTLGLALFLGAYFLAAVVFGETAIALIFNEPEYAGQRHLINVLVAALAIRGVRIAWNAGLKALNRPQWNFAAGILELTIATGGTVVLARYWGLLGAAYAVLLAALPGTALRAWMFYRGIRHGRVTEGV